MAFASLTNGAHLGLDIDSSMLSHLKAFFLSLSPRNRIETSICSAECFSGIEKPLTKPFEVKLIIKRLELHRQ
jgi:hypothetical protein